MRYIVTKLIQETPAYHMEFRGSKLFDSIEAVQEYCKEEYNSAKAHYKRINPNEIIFDDTILGQDTDHHEACCCKVCETIRYGRPYMLFFATEDNFVSMPVGRYHKYMLTVLAEEENQEAYEVLLKQHELHTGLNIENCFIKTVQLGNFTAVYDNMDHGYIDLELMIENNVSTSVWEKAQYPSVDLKLRIFVETTMSEKQQELFHVLRGFKLDILKYVKRVTRDPDPEVGMFSCNLMIRDNIIRMGYKTKPGGGCTHRPAIRIRYQWIKKGD